MKKSFLLLLSFLPLFSSCNKNGGFPNPFPNDTYVRTGFKLDDKVEKITRVLTNAETNLVINTLNNKTIYDPKVTGNLEAKRETRDYTRAFAGEFKQGYSVSNIMKTEAFNTYVQKEDGTKSGNEGKAILKTHNEITTISQYSYGEIKENLELDDYYYYSNGTATKDAHEKEGSSSVNKRSKRVENGQYTKVYDSVVVSATSQGSGTYTDDEDLKYLQLHQSDYIITPDSKCGANDKGEIILVSAKQIKHKEDGVETGVFSLKDGRKYQAMDNSLTVTKLTPQDDKTWGLATYIRVYKETVITSEVIQPNVQITKLKTPITISFSEEINKFTNDDKIKITDDLPLEQ